MIGIYKITNKLDGKSYIGQSIHCEQRFNEHCTGNSQFIDQVIHVTSKDNFDFEILEKVDQEHLSEREDYYIMKYNTLYPNGYNKRMNISKNRKQEEEKETQEEKVSLASQWFGHDDNTPKEVTIEELRSKYYLTDLSLNIYLFLYKYKNWCQEKGEDFKVMTCEQLGDILNIKKSSMREVKIFKSLLILWSIELLDMEAGVLMMNNKKVQAFKLKSLRYDII